MLKVQHPVAKADGSGRFSPHLQPFVAVIRFSFVSYLHPNSNIAVAIEPFVNQYVICRLGEALHTS